MDKIHSIKDKIIIRGFIEVETGLHIGGNESFSAIGEADSVIIKDPISDKPFIPGSSLKGKIRNLLARNINNDIVEPNGDSDEIKRLFGASNPMVHGKLIFRDCFWSNEQSKINEFTDEHSITEVKPENTINRITAIAKPRFIERVSKGNYFNFELVYNVSDTQEIDKDFENILFGLKLLEWDYLGGNGTRGYGKVKFSELRISSLINAKYESLEKLLENRE